MGTYWQEDFGTIRYGSSSHIGLHTPMILLGAERYGNSCMITQNDATLFSYRAKQNQYEGLWVCKPLSEVCACADFWQPMAPKMTHDFLSKWDWPALLPFLSTQTRKDIFL